MDLNEQIKTELEELGSEFCTAVLFVGLRLFKESRKELAQEHFNSRSFRFSLSSTVPLDFCPLQVQRKPSVGHWPSQRGNATTTLGGPVHVLEAVKCMTSYPS